MSGIEGGGETTTPDILRTASALYWVLYIMIFLLFLAIVAMGLKHGGNGVAGVIATGLLWVLYSAYPNRPRIDI